MPCRGPDEREIIGDYSRQIDTLTRVCCDLRACVRRGGTEAELTKETKVWIAKHDKHDRERIAQESREGLRRSIKARALAKLDIDEREALGL